LQVIFDVDPVTADDCQDIDTDVDIDRASFEQRLSEGLHALQLLVKQASFGSGPRSFSASPALKLFDSQGRSLSRLGAWPIRGVEASAPPLQLRAPQVALAGRPFSRLRAHWRAQRQRALGPLAQRMHARALAVGGLLGTRIPNELDDAAKRVEGGLCLQLSAAPREYAGLFNASLLLSAPMIAAAGNSPGWLDGQFWCETRAAQWSRPLGTNWVRKGAYELFLESVTSHPIRVGRCSDEADPLRVMHDGKLPQLHELRWQCASVPRWLAPIYDPNGTSNLRIEMSALSAGPSDDDMLANASFWLGASLGLKQRMSEFTARMPFAAVEENFQQAAQHGLDAELSWPSGAGGRVERVSARELLLSLLPYARSGLDALGVDANEAEEYLSLLEARVRSGQTGAVWQRAMLSELQEQGLSGPAARAALIERYARGCDSGAPVHDWAIGAAEGRKLAAEAPRNWEALEQ
jgi:hypothetical protein